jgi:histidinol-phosphate phosphatase family protein
VLAPFMLLLDRDGTVIVDKQYLADPNEVELERHAAAGLRTLIAQGAVPVIVTNQSGVARRYFSEATVAAVHARLDAVLRAQGVALAGYFFCPHGPNDGCDCRKPRAGLAHQAAAALGMSLDGAVVVGDKVSDLQLADAIGATGVLVRTGEGAKSVDLAERQGWLIADDLLDASKAIVSSRSARQNKL